MFKSNITSSSLESITKEMNIRMGADRIQFVQKATGSKDEEFLMVLEYTLCREYDPRDIDPMKPVLKFLDSFFSNLADRICYGEIKTLRELCRNLEDRYTLYKARTDEQIKDLECYKIAYELK